MSAERNSFEDLLSQRNTFVDLLFKKAFENFLSKIKLLRIYWQKKNFRLKKAFKNLMAIQKSKDLLPKEKIKNSA